MIAEFRRQVDTLLDKGYPEAAGVKAAAFRKHIDPLVDMLSGLAGEEDRIPFVIVVKSDLVSGEEAIARVERRDRTAFSVMDAEEIERFEPIDQVSLPDSLAYLMTDVDSGRDTLNVTPDDALETIRGRNRSPLTIDEGVALVTQYPEAVAKNGGFSLLGSRCGDRRVTAWWISSGRPKLAWCWAGNPHTWLGSASCAGRIGA